MAVQIPGIAQPYKLPEVASPVDMLQAQGMQQQNALRAMSLQQGQQEMEGQNAIRQAFGNEQSFNPATGAINGNAIRQVLAANPAAGMKLLEQMDRIQSHNALVDQRRASIKETEQKMALRLLPLEHNIIAAQTDAYTKAKSAGGSDDEAMQRALTVGMTMVDSLSRSAILGSPDVVDKFKVGVSKFDPVNSPSTMQTEKNYLRSQSGDDVMYVDQDGNQFRPGTMGTPIDVWDIYEKKWGPFSGTAKGFRKLGAAEPLSIQMVEARAEAGARGRAAGAPVGIYGNTYGEMTPEQKETVDFYAAMLLGGDNAWRVGLSRNKDGAALIKAVDERAPALASELGFTAADVGTNRGIRVSTQAALNANTKDLATIKPYAAMLDQNTEILKGLSRKAILTDAALANRPLNWLRTNATDNPDVAEYLAQMEIVKNEATRVISNPRLVGQMTDTARKEIETVINGTMPLQATERVLDRIKDDSHRRVSTMETQQKELETRLKKLFPTGNKPETAKAVGAGTKSSPIKMTTDADFDSVPSGGYFIAPGETRVRGPKP